MSRPLRIDYPDAWHHVMSRARRGYELFQGNEDFFCFLELLKDTTDMFHVNISAYCLMSNHYHLLLQTPDANLARCMRHINGVYTQKYNARHGCDGTLFKGRYKSIIIDADNYLLQLVRYIHKNPQRAGLVQDLHVYPWSSHKGYLSSAKNWDWLYKDFVFSLISKNRSARIKHYREFMEMDDSQEIIHHFSNKNTASVLGSDKFIEWIKGKYYPIKSDKEVPESKRLAPGITQIKEAVCRSYEVEEDDLLIVKRGQENEARDVAMYIMRALNGDRLIEIAEEFKLTGYSSVSNAHRRIKEKLRKNYRFRKRYREILENLSG